MRLNLSVCLSSWLMALLAGGPAYSKDVSGTISSTLTITENSRFTGNVTCTVTGAPCLTIGASNVTLDLNGYSMTGQGDPHFGCSGAGTAGEFGIFVGMQQNVVIRGLGIVQQLRNTGILLNNSSGVTVTGVTTSTNCFSGILLNGGATDNTIENNISIRNGHLSNPCGGICLAGALRTRVRGNRASGNGFAAQGANFGIGLPSPADTGNVIEQNTIVGNTNGIFLGPGVKGNLFRLNVVNGNPAVQIGLDHPSAAGFDILNLSTAGDNFFEGNGCLTSVNAPCPSVGTSFTADPNPITVSGSASLGQTTLSWNAPDAQVVEIHVGAPNGPLFATQGNRGSLLTGPWVSDGLIFYLQDVTGGKALTSDYTLATLTVHLQVGKTARLLYFFNREPRLWAGGMFVLVFGLSLGLVRQSGRLRTAVAGAALLAAVLIAVPQVRAQQTPQQTAAKLDQMIAAHKSEQEMAQYVFDTHGCKSCHTVGQAGKLGFTARGKQLGSGFEGCIRLLTDMTVIAQTPGNQRSSRQQQEATSFGEFGCTFCHQISPGKLTLTEVGTKLSHLHLGCVDIEKKLANGTKR